MRIDICCTRKRRAFSRAGVPDPTTHQLGSGGEKKEKEETLQQTTTEQVVDRKDSCSYDPHPPTQNQNYSTKE